MLAVCFISKENVFTSRRICIFLLARTRSRFPVVLFFFLEDSRTQASWRCVRSRCLAVLLSEMKCVISLCFVMKAFFNIKLRHFVTCVIRDSKRTLENIRILRIMINLINLNMDYMKKVHIFRTKTLTLLERNLWFKTGRSSLEIN